MSKNIIIILAVLLVAAALWLNRKPAAAPPGTYSFELSDAEWKQKLSEEAYKVLRQHGTERAFSGPYHDLKDQGTYHCAGCGLELFRSEHKFDSGTGWPSFYEVSDPEAVGRSQDYKLVVPRTEVHCNRCGGHLGHVFNDGPKPTGLRYCINSVSLDFEAGSSSESDPEAEAKTEQKTNSI